MKFFLTGFLSAILIAVFILFLLPDEPPVQQEQTIDLQIIEPEQERVPETPSAEDREAAAHPFDKLQPAPGELTPAETAIELIGEEMDGLSMETEQPAESLMVVHQVKSGDTLLSIFNALSINQEHYHRLIASKEISKGLSRLRPGQMLYFHFDENRELTQITHESNAIQSDNYHFGDEGVALESVKKAVETRTETAQGTIRSSLFADGQNAGMSGKLIMNMAKLFNYDIDFGSELKQGDYFAVIYEADFVDGERIGTGNILAAEFVNNKKQYRVVRYEDDYGNIDYFDEEGRSRKKKFIRTPLNFTRISSRFTRKRWHPVLKRWRSHKGVDYAAPTGTPVWATGDGVVNVIGRQRGYGKVIYIKHGQYITVYGHLNGFKRGLKKGDRVKQGQVIGYVGQTGLATGPHLHYEFRVNGKHVNPLSAKLPVADPLNRTQKKRFLATAEPLFRALDLLKGRDVAMNDR
ncbi:MAG: peptidoglycan DD-metalloendopeptidase family protein [Gammaproteobacteria bacterium]|jgi:murein DD-endopeptidase MepM/ murein hydrolase activator NlpD